MNEVPDRTPIAEVLSPEDFSRGLRTYGIAILSVIPGIVAGSGILVLWYFAVVYLLFNKKIESLLILFVVWNFLARGAYQYHLLGQSETAPLVRYLNAAILGAIFLLYLRTPKRASKFVKILLVLSALWSLVALASAFVNGVALVHFIEYYLIYFRWLLFAIVILTVRIDSVYLRSLVGLLFAIVASNSVFAVFQQLALPIQTTPAGYTPSYFDLASGMLGVTYSQHLTALCLTLGGYHTIRYFGGESKRDLVKMALFFLQPFASSSKAFLIIVGLLIVVVLIWGFLTQNTQVRIRNVVPKLIVAILIVVVGLQVYERINRSVFGSPLAPVETYLGSITTPEDAMKVMGYVTAATVVAPSGNVGAILGVGPTRFLNVVSGGGETYYSSFILRGNELEDLSSVDKQDTEVVGNLGELGYLGVLAQILTMALIILHYLSITRHRGPIRDKALELTILLFSCAVFFFTFYTQAWSIAFYYIPLFILIRWQEEISSGFIEPSASLKNLGVEAH